MARTLNEVYLRIVFSTKHRVNVTHLEIEAELHRYNAGIIANLDSRCIAINGTENHARHAGKDNGDKQPGSLGKEGIDVVAETPGGGHEGLSTSTVSPTTHVIFGTDATAPRSVRYGRRFRGSREGSLHSPARDPRLFHRPLRGRGIHRSAVAELTALRSRN